MNEKIKALKLELALVKLQLSERIDIVEKRLNIMLDQEVQPIEPQSTIFTQVEAIECIEKQQQTDEHMLPKTARIISVGSLAEENEWQMPTPSEPSFIAVFMQTMISSFFDWLSPVSNIYRSYKERGMLGIFILTVVGIGLTLAGFGYLMQLLIDHLDVGAKSLLMCLVSISVMGLGVALKTKTRFDEFATAIVALGILLAYSTVYFSGSVYGLFPSILVLILYLFIALVCHVFALWLDTKVVAALGIIGIATMPILSNTISIEPLYYLYSLSFVVCSSLILAHRHVGQWLAHLSLAFTLVSLEWILGFENILISVWMINLFYLLFFTYITVTLVNDKTETNQRLVFLATLAGSSIFILFQANNISTSQMSLIFALNTVISIAVSMFFYRVKRELTHFFILLSASWALLTIVTVISDAYWGIAWAVEGILLISIGRHYKISSPINQGQTLTAIALIYCWFALAMHFPLPALKSIQGWMLSIMIVIIVGVWQRLINTSKVFNNVTQNRIKPYLQFIEVFWISILVIASAHLWLGNWTGVLIILLQLALLFRAKHCRQVSIEILAATLILVALFYAYQGVIQVQSYRFILLPLFSKLAVISAFLQLWLWSAFYRKYHPNSAIKEVAETVRILFYLLIPVCWLASVIRRFDEAALMLLWLSPLLALFLATKVKHPLLAKETKILTGLACLCFAVIIGQLTLINGIIAFIGFLIFYTIAYLINRKKTDHLYQFICSCGLISVGFALPNIVFFQTNNLLYAVIIASVYWAMAFNMMNVTAHLKRNQIFISVVNLLLVIGAWSLIPSNELYVLVPIIFLVSILYKKESKFKHSQLGAVLQLNSDLFLHSIAIISYVILLFSLGEYRMNLLIAPVLAIHGAYILFLKDRRITTVKYSFGLILLGIVKLSVIDAANALLWQKVILFMGIGIFILVSSFWYQKLVSTNEELK